MKNHESLEDVYEIQSNKPSFTQFTQRTLKPSFCPRYNLPHGHEVISIGLRSVCLEACPLYLLDNDLIRLSKLKMVVCCAGRLSLTCN